MSDLATSYLALRHLHIGAVTLSGGLFLLRGMWMLLDSPQLQARWVRVLPHVIDTVLLLSAIALTLIIQQYPLTHGWLTAKVLALLAYIGLGSVALKRGGSRRTHIAAFMAAVGCFAYIVGVALHHDPASWFAG